MMNFVGRTLEKRNLRMSLSLNNIGFYTLTEDRARLKHNNLERCEMIVTSKCNFACPYCRGVKTYSRDCIGDIDLTSAKYVLDSWIDNGLKNVRFSGGEPTIYPYINNLVKIAKSGNIDRIAISSNGSQNRDSYQRLLDNGVNDFSISLDACCASGTNKMAGKDGYFETIISNIEYLSKSTYVTVGIVLTEENAKDVSDIVKFAYDLGVSDIRIISSAQYNGFLFHLEKIPNEILDIYPILKYRVNNFLSDKFLRGIGQQDSKRCYLVEDDYAVAGKWHFPCVIHMREGGEPIGEVGENMQEKRIEWSKFHNTHEDPICKKNCLDCLVDYNNKVEFYRI